ncbi:MAG: ubiquinol oxidase subunit II [Gallionella sp.]
MIKINCHSAFAGLPALCLAVFLSGCSRIPLLDPKGPVGDSELHDIEVAFALMLIVVIPVIFMALWFPRKFRASDPNADYDPKWSDSVKIDLVTWLIPAAIVLALGALSWKETHRLDPFKPIDPSVSPINIEAVSLDWKWLFIYPGQNIAAVNQLVLPANVPVSLRITSDTVMTSFFIPQLGSQIYAMAGMQTRLHLLADTPGVYFGQNQQYSGRGYSDMNFKVSVTSLNQFKAWVQKVKQSPDRLDLARFKEISKPSVDYPVASFSWVERGLFANIVDKSRNDRGNLANAPRDDAMTSGTH